MLDSFRASVLLLVANLEILDTGHVLASEKAKVAFRDAGCTAVQDQNQAGSLESECLSQQHGFCFTDQPLAKPKLTSIHL